MIIPANDRDLSPTTAATGAPDGSVIDLREGPTTRVRVSRDDNPFSALAPPERMRLIIRVLCELVAYDEIDDPVAHRHAVRATGADPADPARHRWITG